jgi:uncharacterized membrane protein YuzA (DUF378 family)
MKSAFHWIVVILLIIGGLNWGLVVFDYNLVTMILGEGTMAAKIVYALVGLAAIAKLFMLGNCCKKDQPTQSQSA